MRVRGVCACERCVCVCVKKREPARLLAPQFPIEKVSDLKNRRFSDFSTEGKKLFAALKCFLWK